MKTTNSPRILTDSGFEVYVSKALEMRDFIEGVKDLRQMLYSCCVPSYGGRKLGAFLFQLLPLGCGQKEKRQRIWEDVGFIPELMVLYRTR